MKKETKAEIIRMCFNGQLSIKEIALFKATVFSKEEKEVLKLASQEKEWMNGRKLVEIIKEKYLPEEYSGIINAYIDLILMGEPWNMK